MRALLCTLCLIVCGLAAGRAVWADPVSVPPGSTYNTPGNNSVTNNGTAPIIVDCYFEGPDEVIEVSGNGAVVNLLVSGTAATVDGNNTTVNHNATGTTSDAVGKPTQVNNATSANASQNAGGNVRTQSSR